MTIPEIRAALLGLADRIGVEGGLFGSELAGEVRTLALATTRRSAVRRAPARYARLTEERQAAIRAYASNNPTASYTTIARRFETGPGRVSEAVAGKRT